MKFDMTEHDLTGLIPESWLCVDLRHQHSARIIQSSGAGTGFCARRGWHRQHINSHSEVYIVRDAVWKRAGMEPLGGCLCIGCLEQRLGRRLKPKDFKCGDSFNHPRIPDTERLLRRRKDRR
jgi:hypothetical protein